MEWNLYIDNFITPMTVKGIMLLYIVKMCEIVVKFPCES